MKFLGWIILALMWPDLCFGAAVGFVVYRALGDMTQ